MLRRSIILSAVASVAACNTLTSAAAWAQNASILSSGLAAVAPQIGAVAGIPAATITAAQDALRAAASFAADLAKITDPNAATPIVIKVENGLNSALSALSLVAALLPPPIAIALSAAQVLVPVIEAAINPLLVKPSAAANAMSPDQARLILLGVAAKR